MYYLLPFKHTLRYYQKEEKEGGGLNKEMVLNHEVWLSLHSLDC